MNDRFRFEQNESPSFQADEVSKAAALIYLHDAIENERYEQASGDLQSARAFGASSDEIDVVIASVFEQTDNTTVRFGAYEETE